MAAPTGSTTDLLSQLIVAMGPCSQICDHTIPLGGTGGTSTVSIITGMPVTTYPPNQ
jgi:hypothetical protein